MVTSNTTSNQPAFRRIIQGFHLVWVDENINTSIDDCRKAIAQLRQVINVVNTFANIDEAIDFITDRPETTAFMLVSERSSRMLIPIVQAIPQIQSICILSQNNAPLQTLTSSCPKISGVFADIESVCQALRKASNNCDRNEISLSFAKSASEPLNANKNTLDCTFMYTGILKDILLTIDFNDEHITEFLNYCREIDSSNDVLLQKLDTFRKDYRLDRAIWWYSSENFIFSTLNRALRLMDINIILKMGFFLRDLHNQITTLHSQQFGTQTNTKPFVVYRGQGLSQADFNQLQNNIGGLLSFNNFLSTSYDREVSEIFAESIGGDSNLTGVLFKLTMNPSITTTSFADINAVGKFSEEGEILFSMHSVFRIGKIKKLARDTPVWEVELTLTSDDDPELRALSDQIQKEVKQPTGWKQLGQLLIRLAKFDKAEELYELLLKQTNDQGESAHLLHHLGSINLLQGKLEKAIRYFERSVKICETIIPKSSDLATSYNNIGLVYNAKGEYWKALEYYDKALEIRKTTLPANHPSLATPYNNIGMVYDAKGEYSKALEYYDKALEIRKTTLPANHPSLATSYNNIGMVYDAKGEYSKALEYCDKALQIEKTTLPANHPSLATSYNNIGMVYNAKGEYSKALEYYDKALEIRKTTLPANHPSLASSYNNIGSVYNAKGEYSKALEYYDKALQIEKTTLPANHPDLATSYNNIGLVYNAKGEYSKALEYYDKALEIRKKTLPANHPSLATSYNNIGGVYDAKGEYSKALEYYDKALEIRKTTLPANHPSLATSYNNIGGVYDAKGEYSKALEYYDKALEIRKKTLPANHPSLATSYNNIGSVYYNKGEHFKALEYLELAVGICQRSLPVDHPKLTTLKQNIEEVKNRL